VLAGLALGMLAATLSLRQRMDVDAIGKVLKSSV